MSFERDNEDQTEVTQRRKAMLHRNLMMVGILAIAGLQLSACKHVAAAKTEPEHPAQVKRVEGTEFSSVTLTEKAVQRSEEHRLNSSHTVISYAVFGLKKK